MERYVKGTEVVNFILYLHQQSETCSDLLKKGQFSLGDGLDDSISG